MIEVEHYKPSGCTEDNRVKLEIGGKVTFFDSDWVRPTRVYGEYYQLKGGKPEIASEVKKKAIDEVLALPIRDGGYGMSVPTKKN